MTKPLFLAYDGHQIQFRDDGWFNATNAAERFGKETTFWLNQRDTVEYVTALAQHLGKVKPDFLKELSKIKALDGVSAASKGKLLRLVKKTGLVATKAGAPETGGGTWMHPKLAVAFARWLDPKFGVWCDLQIEQIVHGTPEQTDWQRLRHEAASSYKVMSDVLTETRADTGKETCSYHYANEAKLVNWAMTGEYAALDRAQMSTVDLDILARLEARNAVLIAKDASRELRRELLQASAEQMRKRRLAGKTGGAA